MQNVLNDSLLTVLDGGKRVVKLHNGYLLSRANEEVNEAAR